MDEPDANGQPEPQRRRRLAWVVAGAVAFVIVAVAVVFLYMGSTRTKPDCAEWERAKAQYVQAFPPIAQQTKAQLADFNGYVDVGGTRVTRPPGC